jgi:hypothetical protein
VGRYGANTVYTGVKMEKMRPVEAIPGIAEEGIQENGRAGELNYDKYII